MRFNRLRLKKENISEVFLYRRLEFRYLLADDINISLKTLFK